MAEQVLVFPTDLLPEPRPRGFFTDTTQLAAWVAAAFFMGRAAAETDPRYKQIIPYTLLRCGERIFSYFRTGGGKDARLHHRGSIGVGGHVNPIDSGSGGGLAMIEAARDREMAEEFAFMAASAPRLVGLLNDDQPGVSAVHFGLVYEIWLAQPHVLQVEHGKHRDLAFHTVAELVRDAERYEGWSQIVIDGWLAARG